MENKDQPKGNTPMPENPQPKDEVQLNIETVTPDTEKNVVPTEGANEQQTNNKEVKQEVEPDKEGNEQESEESVEEEGVETEEENVSAGQADSDEEANEDEHPGDDIETVSP